jgi:hypothetical protein
LAPEAHPDTEKAKDEGLEKIETLRNEMKSLHASWPPWQHDVLRRLTTEIPWKVHKANDKAVCEALDSIKPEDLKNHPPLAYCDNVMALRGNVWVMQGRQLLEARERGIIQKLPQVTEAELEDRSKADVVAKFLALAQTSVS